jgi:tetratricopeptide (TPR) repeat protein
MPIEGSLREIDLHDLLQIVQLSRKTGELSVVSEATRKRGAVVFRDGAVVGCAVDNAALDLGHLLLNAGKITEAQLACARDVRDQDPDRTWGEVFRSLALVSNEEMEKHIRFQVEEFVYEILHWEDGLFFFSERPVVESECVTLIPIESLLMERARRADEMSALPTTLGTAKAVPCLAQSGMNGGVIDLSPPEWEVIGEIDGIRDVQSIAWQIGRSEFEVSKIVSKLVEEGLVEVSSTPEPDRTKPPHEITLDKVEQLLEQGDLSEAEEKIAFVLAEHSDEPRAHYLRARVFERSNDHAGAARSYETTLRLDPLADDARRRLGLMKLRLGEMSGAAREWEAYLRMVTDARERGLIVRAMAALRELELVEEELDDSKGD